MSENQRFVTNSLLLTHVVIREISIAHKAGWPIYLQFISNALSYFIYIFFLLFHYYCIDYFIYVSLEDQSRSE